MKKVIAFLIIICTSFTSTGCWDSTETEKLGVVTLMGINLDGNNKIRVVVHETMGNKDSSEYTKSAFRVYQESAPTISEAVQKVSRSQHHRVYFAHIKVIILSEELVTSVGIMPIIDFCERNPEIRFTTKMLVSKRNQFDKIFNANIGAEADTGTILEEIIKNKKENAFFTVNDLKDFTELLNTSGSEAYTAGVSMLEGDSSKIKSNIFNINDTAVFKETKMVGWFKGDESRGILWVNGQVKGGIIKVPFENEEISLKILKVISKVHPVVNDGKMSINADIEVNSNIDESKANVDFMNEDVIKKVQELQSKKIRDEINEAFYKSKNFNSDIFGFGNYFSLKYPVLWKSMQDNWYAYYPEISLNVNVNSIIKNLGESYKPLNR